MRLRRAFIAGILAGTTALVLLVPAGAPAAYDPVRSGSVKILLAKPFARILAENHIRIVTSEGAVRRGASIVLPAAGGEIDSALGAGTIEAEGAVAFVGAKRRVPFRELTFKAKRAPLYAKVGGGQLKLATAGRLRDRRVGFGSSFSAGDLRLTAKVASRLGKKLGLRSSLRPGQLIGSLEATAQPATVQLREEGRVKLALDQVFKQKLDNLFVSLNPIAPAELAAGPVLSFPVGPESTLSPDAIAGTLKLGGSLELLQLGNAQVFWREVWLQPDSNSLLAETDVEPSPPHPGKQPQAPVLSLQSGALVASDPASRTIDLSGEGVALTAATAAALNDAFAPSQSVFSSGETVGSVSFSVRSQ
jgi:hypothetical protein